MLILALAACSGPDGADPTADTDVAPTPTATPTGHTADTADTGAPPQDGPITVACATSATNALRATCAVTVDPPQAVAITYVDAAGARAPRVAHSDDALGTHTVELYLMPADTPYAATATAPGDPALPPATATFRTGVPPSDAVIHLPATSGASTAPLIGMASPCAGLKYAVVVDGPTGELLWYEPLGGLPYDGLTAASFTEDGTVLVIAGTSVVEVDPHGEERLRLSLGAELDLAPHHDVFRKDGLTYVLFHEPYVDDSGLRWTTDGFYVFDAAGVRVGEWHLAQEPLLVPNGPQVGDDADDWSHANAVWTDGSGEVLLSFRHLDAVVAIDGAVGTPGFGTLRWRLAGPASPIGSDFAITTSVPGPADFAHQHNVHRLPDGTLTMLDNRVDGEGLDSRVIDLVLDEAAHQAEIVAAYPLPLFCPFEGGAWRTPAGNPLATCGALSRGYEFDAATAATTWSATVSCELGAFYVARFVPLADW